MLNELKRASLSILKGMGIFHVVRNSKWRQRRLLILCYHGISLKDEHLWKPNLYMQPQLLEQRLRILKQGGYHVLPLTDALNRVCSRDLPPRSIAITFDDGFYDFYKQAYPLLKAFGFPATVYQSTYYSDYPRPIFNLICDYMVWKNGGIIPDQGRELGLDIPTDRTKGVGQRLAVEALVSKAQKEDLNGQQKEELARRLAKLLGIDYDELLESRVLQLMNRQEITQLAAEGVDFQLHTHRHRTPDDAVLFQKEIQDNRRSLQRTTGSVPVHFCYPSGVYNEKFLPWLEAENVVSATTCDVGFATSKTNKLLLPRFVDTSYRTAVEFEGWATGVENLIRRRRTANHFGHAGQLSRG
jgi:peptidoglycan/xylan/chitin deacetylase (PgdA/CDA1 family)